MDSDCEEDQRKDVSVSLPFRLPDQLVSAKKNENNDSLFGSNPEDSKSDETVQDNDQAGSSDSSGK